MEFKWQELLDRIYSRRVVPVIGLDLVDTPRPGCPTPLYRQIAAGAAEILQKNGDMENLPADVDWPALMEASLGGKRPINRGVLSEAIDDAYRQLQPAITLDSLPESLRLLSQIKDFPLVLTTMVDGSVAKAFGSSGENLLISRINYNANLPLEWKPPDRGSPPTLVHLFGRINAAPDFAMNEEDVMEFMGNLQGANRPEGVAAPAELLERLKDSDLLLLGTRFPDWLARFFIRLLRSGRLSDQGRTGIEAVADPASPAQLPLVAFLKKYSLRTRIYDEGTPLEFIRTLVNKWEKTAVQGDERAKLPPMRKGSIMLSYSRKDSDAAWRIFTSLRDKAKLDVWMDVEDLGVGSNYTAIIKDNIARCDLFLPVLSANTLETKEGYFRKEWQWARERLDGMEASHPFPMPLVVSGEMADHARDIARYFQCQGRDVDAEPAPNGNLDEKTLKTFVAALQTVRSANFCASATA